MGNKKKEKLAVLQAHSVREIIDSVNDINQASCQFDDIAPILKEDIVTIFKGDENYFLLYYK